MLFDIFNRFRTFSRQLSANYKISFPYI